MTSSDLGRRASRGRNAAVLAVFLLPAGPGLRADDVIAPASSVEIDASELADPAVLERASLDSAGLADPLSTGETLLALAQQDTFALGPLSIGTPDAGLLVNPLPMPDDPLWTIRNPAEAFATAETIGFIRTAIQAVATRYPGSPRLVIGDLSRPDGGRLNRHRSHQVGRDADLGLYYSAGEEADFEIARRRDLDLPRTWALVRALLTETDVERIFLDRSLLRVLYEHAVESGEDRGWLDDVFGRLGEDRKGILQHERRHKNHLHVRFYNREAQERGRLVYPVLVRRGALPPPVIKHRVGRGETLGHLARRYGASAAAIRAANGLHGSRLRAGRGYLIPVRRVPDLGPIVVPPRRLPPSLQALATPAPPASAAALGSEAGDASQR